MTEVAAAADVLQCLFVDNQLLAEGPLYQHGWLYWVDIKGLALHRLQLATAEHQQRHVPEQITSISPRQSGGFVVTTRTGFGFIDDFSAPLRSLGVVEPALPDNRFNDAKVDPFGNLWAGTMDDLEKTPCGSLYRLTPEHQWQVFDTGYIVTNGPTFAPDGRRLFHNDSVHKQIFVFDLDASGISNKRVFAQLGVDHGHPDGMTVDAQGCLWVCEYAGWGISRFDPDGKFMAKLALPVANVTSCTFGGDQRETLYITTAAKGLTAAELAEQPLAGSIFAAAVGVQGIQGAVFLG